MDHWIGDPDQVNASQSFGPFGFLTKTLNNYEKFIF